MALNVLRIAGPDQMLVAGKISLEIYFFLYSNGSL